MGQDQTKTYLTRHSLIQRLKTVDDQQAWEEFVFHYRPFIFFLVKKMQIEISEQDDLFQEILLKLYQNLESYSKEKGRFRSWLGTIIRNCALNYHRDRKRITNKVDNLGENLEVIVSYKAEEFERIIEKEWHNYVLDLAFEKLGKIFDQNIIRCFKMTLDRKSPEQISKALNITKESVYTLRSRFKARLTAEVRQILEELEF